MGRSFWLTDEPDIAAQGLARATVLKTSESPLGSLKGSRPSMRITAAKLAVDGYLNYSARLLCFRAPIDAGLGTRPYRLDQAQQGCHKSDDNDHEKDAENQRRPTLANGGFFHGAQSQPHNNKKSRKACHCCRR